MASKSASRGLSILLQSLAESPKTPRFSESNVLEFKAWVEELYSNKLRQDPVFQMQSTIREIKKENFESWSHLKQEVEKAQEKFEPNQHLLDELERTKFGSEKAIQGLSSTLGVPCEFLTNYQGAGGATEIFQPPLQPLDQSKSIDFDSLGEIVGNDEKNDKRVLKLREYAMKWKETKDEIARVKASFEYVALSSAQSAFENFEREKGITQLSEQVSSMKSQVGNNSGVTGSDFELCAKQIVQDVVLREDLLPMIQELQARETLFFSTAAATSTTESLLVDSPKDSSRSVGSSIDVLSSVTLGMANGEIDCLVTYTFSKEFSEQYISSKLPIKKQRSKKSKTSAEQTGENGSSASAESSSPLSMDPPLTSSSTENGSKTPTSCAAKAPVPTPSPPQPAPPRYCVVLAMIEAKRNPNDIAHGFVMRNHNLGWLTQDRSSYTPLETKTKFFPSGHFESFAFHAESAAPSFPVGAELSGSGSAEILPPAEKGKMVKYAFDSESFSFFKRDEKSGLFLDHLYFITQQRSLIGLEAGSLSRFNHRLANDLFFDLEDRGYLRNLLSFFNSEILGLPDLESDEHKKLSLEQTILCTRDVFELYQDEHAKNIIFVS